MSKKLFTDGQTKTIVRNLTIKSESNWKCSSKVGQVLEAGVTRIVH